MLSVEHTPGETALGARHVTCVRPFWPWRFEWTAFAGQCAQQAAKGVGAVAKHARDVFPDNRSEEHTSELQSLMRISYAVLCLQKKKEQTSKIHPLIHLSKTHIYSQQ